MDAVENTNCNQEKELIRIDFVKTERKEFLKAKKGIELQALKADIMIGKNKNHIKHLDNYLHLYAPIKTQNQVNTTLRHTFSTKERQRLDVYEQEMIMDLYVRLLKDEGKASVVQSMRAIHEKAVIEGQLLQEL